MGKEMETWVYLISYSSFRPLKFRQRICHLIWIYLSIGNFTLKSWFVHSFIGISLNECWLRGCCKPWRMRREQGFQASDLLSISDTKARATQRMTDRIGTCISPMAWRQYLSHIIGKGAFLCRLRSEDIQVTAPWRLKLPGHEQEEPPPGCNWTLDQCY